MLKHLKKIATVKGFIVYFVVHGVIIVAVVFSAIRIMLPHLKGNLPHIEKLASESFGVDIKVDKMDTGWRGFEPTLRFEGVTMLNAQTEKPLAEIKYFDVQLDLFSSIRHFKFIPGRLTLEGVSLTFEQEPDGNFRLQNHLMASERSVIDTLATLLSKFKRLDVKNGNIELNMQEGNPVYLNLKYMSFFPRDNKYRFESELSGTQIPTEIKIIADIHGELETLDQSTVDGYLQLAHVRYDSRFMPLKFHSLNPQAGNLDLDAWFRWENGNWIEVLGDISLHQVMIQNIQRPEVIQPFSLKANIAWQRLGGDFWRLSGDHIAVDLGNESSPTAAFMLQGGSFEPWNFRLTAIAVDDVIDLLALSDQIDSKTRQAFHHLNARGEIHDILWVATPTDQGFKDWRLGMKLDDLHWQNYQHIPAMSGLSGEIKLSEHQGQFNVDSQHGSLNFPDLFEAPINFDHIRGQVSWSSDKQWSIQSDNLVFSNQDLNLETSFKLNLPEGNDSPLIYLKASTGEFNHAVAKKYLPTKILPPGLVKWVNESIENGRVTTMRSIVKGPVNQFPFKSGQGEFELRFTLDEIDLHFHPSWPTVHQLSGDLAIDGKGLQAFVDTGSVNGSTILPSTVTLDFAKPSDPLILKIAGSIKGSAHDSETFIKASPLWNKLGNVFTLVEIRGPLSLDFKTEIPIRGPADLFKIDGSAHLTDGTVNLPNWGLSLNEVKGDLQFTQNSVKTAGIQAVFMDKPGLLTATTVQNGSFSDITWNFHSTMNKALIEKFARTHYWMYVDGQSEYDASFKVSIPKREDPFAITLKSDLKGMTLNLPAPLNKKPEQALPTSVTLTFLNPDLMQSQFKLGDYLSGLMRITKNKSEYQLSQGKLVLGSEPNDLPLPDTGLMITGKTPSLVLNTWSDFFSNHSKQFPPKPGEKLPGVVITKLQSADLQYKDWHLTDATLNAYQSQGYWNTDLTSKEIEGVMRFPQNPESNPMIFDLARCTWPLGPPSQTEQKLLPKDVNALNLDCKQFKYKNSNIGRFQLGVQPHRATNSVTFDPILVESEIDKLTAKAEWGTVHGEIRTHFKGAAKTQNAGQSMKGWGLSTDVQDAKGESDFDLNWPGSPKDISGKGLSGEVDLRMQNGRFVGVNPGFGRILGLMSFQGLQRRLRLDFSDVFKSGFAFDTFKSNINIFEGIASTQNGSLKAPAADINFTGKSNLATREVDFDMIVQAHIDATVPAAAVAIANPAAGAAVWIADKMFNPLSNVSKYRYHITGTWDKPEFQDRTEEYRKELSGPAQVREAS